MSKLSGKILLSFFIVFGFLLRFTASITHTYSSDELSAINRLNFDSYAELIETGVKTGDMHPAGVQTFLVLWSKIFGTEEIIYRLPFVLLGTAAIYLVFLLGKRLNEQTGLIAAGIWSTLLFPVLQSELARPYSPGLFFSLLAGWLIVRLLYDSNSKQKNLILCISLGVVFALAMYTHYFAFLFVGFIGVASLLFVKKDRLPYYITSGIIAIILFLPHLSVTLYHTSIEGGLQWLPPPTKGWLLDFIYFAFNESLLIICLILVVLIAGISKSGLKNIPRLFWMFTLWFFGIYIVAFVMSITATPILKYPVMLFPLPFLIITISYFLAHTFKKHITVPAFVICIIIGTSTIFEKKLYSNLHFEVFKELSDPILSWHNKYGKTNFINVMNVSHPNYLNYYPKRKGQSIDLDIDVLYYGDDDKLKQMLSESNKTFCVIGYSGRLTPPYFFRTALAHYPYIVDYVKYTNSATFLLSKTSISPARQEQQKTVLFDFSTNRELWKFNPSNFNLSENYYQLDSIEIYGPEIKLEVSDSLINNSYYIEFEIEAEINQSQLTVVASPERKQGGPVLNLKGEPIWIGRTLESMLGKRGTAYFAFSVPGQMEPGDFLKVYLWNRGKLPVKISSFKILASENIWN